MKRRDFSDSHSFESAMAELVRSAAQDSGAGGVVVPGGKTPMGMYSLLARDKLDLPVDFRFILSDERYCPYQSRDSNAGKILPLLSSAGVENHQFIIPDTSLGLSECAAEFNDSLEFFVGNGGRIRTAILGVGGDGHTAGIFSLDDVELGKERYAVSVVRPDGLAGVTTTFDFLSTAESVVFVLRGKEKEAIVEKMISEPWDVLASVMLGGHPQVQVWFCSE